jgi:hypothetical protein
MISRSGLAGLAPALRWVRQQARYIGGIEAIGVLATEQRIDPADRLQVTLADKLGQCAAADAERRRCLLCAHNLFLFCWLLAMGHSVIIPELMEYAYVRIPVC